MTNTLFMLLMTLSGGNSLGLLVSIVGYLVKDK